METLLRSSGEPRDPTDFIIPGLDVPTVEEARRLKQALDPVCDIYKVGKHFILDPEFSDFLHHDLGPHQRKSIMLDFKDFDIGKSARAFAKQVYNHPSIVYFTVHAEHEQIAAALSERKLVTGLLAVLLLTSFGPDELLRYYGWDVNVDGTPLDFVLERADMALDLGCEGLICSPQEVRPLRKQFGWDFDLIVPGCRPPGHWRDDHKRVGSPAEAVRDGATYVVLSTPFVEAENPYDVYMQVADQISMVI